MSGPNGMPDQFTDWVRRPGTVLVEAMDVWSCSEPDANGEVTAVVVVGGSLLRVKGRRVFTEGNIQ